MIRITNLEQLKEWNKSPTEEKPIVLEWFMNWFFDYALKDKTLANEAYNTIVEFTEKCESMTNEEAIKRVHENLGYWKGYSSRWSSDLYKMFPQIKHPILNI